MPVETPIRLKDAGDQVSTIADADVLLVDGVDGVRTISKADFEAQLAGAPASFNPTNAELIKMVGNNPEAGSLQFLTKTYDANRILESGTVFWPDGSAGVFTTTLKNTTWLDYDAYTISHANSNKTITQATMTRDAFGDVTTKPALTVS